MPNQLYPLTAFEEYMLIDETIDHPMTFFLRAHLEGKVQLAELRAAFGDVVRRHPIFWSTIDRSRGRACWRIDPERMPLLNVQLEQPLRECQLPSHIDLATEPGIRAQLNFGGDQSELWLQFHHSCSDGIGGVSFLKQLFEAYRRRVASSNDAEHRDEPVRFPTRRCAFAGLSRPAKLSRLIHDLARIGSFLRRGNMELDRREEHARDNRPTSNPSFVETRLPLTKVMLEQLKRTHPFAATVNDVVLRDIYLALGDWTLENRAQNGSDWIRILAPINMRHPQTEDIACHNDVGMIFLDRRLDSLGDPAELLSSISREMSHLKRNQMGHAFLRAIHFCLKFPGRLTSIRQMRPAFATAVVSNLGCLGRRGATEPLELTSLTVDHLVFLVPIRAGTPVSFGVLTHATELSIGMQYDDAAMDEASAEQLLTLVRARLAASFGGGSQPVTRRRAG